jgi:hypothetical protein
MTRTLLQLLNAPLLLLAITLGISVQTSLFSAWLVSYFQPDVILPLVIWCSLRRSFLEGGILTLIAANIGEIHSAAPSGLFLVSYMALYLGARFGYRIFVFRTLSSLSGLALVCTLLFHSLEQLLLVLLGSNTGLLQHALLTGCLHALVEGLLSYWIFKFLDWFDWVTYKNPRAEQALDSEFQFNLEGF